jgi:hypothetical protein
MNHNTITYSYGILGFGVAGQLLLLELLQRGVQASSIVIIDENFLGGALVTKYGPVLSNTPWWKTKKALSKYPTEWSAEAITEGDSKYSENQCMPVRDIAKLCLKVALKAGEHVEKITATVNSVQKAENWILSHSFGSLTVQKLFFAHGATEKQLNLDFPAIPLSIAFDKNQLQNCISAEKDKIAVFGMSHSGTICLKNLHELSVKTVGIYDTPVPFLFARDGAYDGIKEGSEIIADSILKGEYENLSLVKYSDGISVYKELKTTTKAIYCIGFKPSQSIGLINLQYDPKTAKLITYENGYGYGIAFPGTTELNEKIYADVSVLSFQEQIERTLPNILTDNNK